MTHVEFYSGIADKPTYVVRLLRRAVGKQKRVAVVADEPTLARLNADLWIENPGDFVAHLMVLHGGAVLPRLHRTPIWLVSDAADAHRCDVLVNLHDAVPTSLPSFKRVIELISVDRADIDAGRKRWRRYQSMPVQLSHPNARVGSEAGPAA